MTYKDCIIHIDKFRRAWGGQAALMLLALMPLGQARPHDWYDELRWPPPPGALLTAELRYVAGLRMFALTVRNGGRDKVAICRWRVLYHIRLLDANGRQLNRDVPVDDYVLPEADQWVVLGFGEAITFLVAAYDKGPRPLRQLPNEARCAECVPVRAAVSPPSFLKDAGVTVARAPRTPRIKLPGPSGTPPARSPQGAAGAADHDQAVFITPRPRSRRSERLRG